jgi:hypothetical protein
MQEINIYVIKTEISKDMEAREQLDIVFDKLLYKYGGVTVLPLKAGYWVDIENKEVCVDVGEIWQIITENADNVINDSLEIKTITKQKSQLVTTKTINSYFL